MSTPTVRIEGPTDELLIEGLLDAIGGLLRVRQELGRRAAFPAGGNGEISAFAAATSEVDACTSTLLALLEEALLPQE